MRSLNKFFKRKKGKLMAIFPHPDDETVMAGGMMTLAKTHGWETHLITLTKGGAGKLHLNPNGLSTKEIRTLELKKAINHLGVDNFILRDFDDGRLLQSKDKWRNYIYNQINKVQPDIVVTYDHTGISGHPDHIVVSVEVKKILYKLGDGRTKLYWVSAPDKFLDKFINRELVDMATKTTHVISLPPALMMKKFHAIRSHKSQKLISMPKLIKRFMMLRYEWYHRVDLKKDYPVRYINFKL